MSVIEHGKYHRHSWASYFTHGGFQIVRHKDSMLHSFEKCLRMNPTCMLQRHWGNDQWDRYFYFVSGFTSMVALWDWIDPGSAWVNENATLPVMGMQPRTYWLAEEFSACWTSQFCLFYARNNFKWKYFISNKTRGTNIVWGIIITMIWCNHWVKVNICNTMRAITKWKSTYVTRREQSLGESQHM